MKKNPNRIDINISDKKRSIAFILSAMDIIAKDKKLDTFQTAKLIEKNIDHYIAVIEDEEAYFGHEMDTIILINKNRF